MKNEESKNRAMIVLQEMQTGTVSSIQSANAVQNEYGKVVFPFTLEKVRLTPGTRLYDMMNAKRNYLLSLNNDSILYSFRQTSGLMDSYRYCCSTTALDMEKKLVSYIKGRMDKLTRARINAFLETRPFFWNFYHEHGGIGEALFDLYQATGEADTLTLADIFDCPYFTGPLADNVDELGYQEYHANSHLSMVLALARRFEVTNDTRYKNAAVNFLAMMTDSHTFPTGAVTFKPLNRVIDENYNEYTIITDPIANIIMDYVSITDQNSETMHNLQSSHSGTGSYNDKNWRDASNDGWFSYRMMVDPGKPNYVRCTYWGGDAADRVFYIQIDGNIIATQVLEKNNPNQFFRLIYPIPAALSNGKSSVIVRFQAKSGKNAGGVYDRVEIVTLNTDVALCLQ